MNDKQEPMVNFEQAKALKALGFNFETLNCYTEDGNFWGQEGVLDVPVKTANNWNRRLDLFSAPTVALALKWCRDVKSAKYDIYYDCFGWNFYFSGKHGNGYEDYDDLESALFDAVIAEIKRLEVGKE